jgi:hypothetical protein
MWMRGDSLRPRWLCMLLTAALLTNGCASTTPPGHGRTLGYTPGVAPGPKWAAGAVRGGRPRGPEEPGRQRATLARQAVLDAVKHVKGTAGAVANSLSTLAARPPGLGTRGAERAWRPVQPLPGLWRQSTAMDPWRAR